VKKTQKTKKIKTKKTLVHKRTALKSVPKKPLLKAKKADKKPKAKVQTKIKTKKKVVIKKKVLNKKIIKKVPIKQEVKPKQYVALERSINNPIIKPRPYSWESKATFNPTAFEYNGKVYLLYRAIGDDDVSVLGHASSFNGYYIDSRLTHYVYRRRPTNLNFNEPYFSSSGGGWSGGCEDARVTLMGDTVYVLYNAFDGWSSVRIAMISISLDDFKNRRFNKWKGPIHLSPAGDIHKAWTLFPEKINGKFALLLDIWPSIRIQYFDDPDELANGKIVVKQIWNRWWSEKIPKHWQSVHAGTDGDRWVEPESLRKNIWKETENDLWVRSVGPSPIKTKDGWLVLFHGIEAKDAGKFKLFAMLLDLKDPTKVLYRSAGPVLEPTEHYEINGWQGIVYSCGAVVKSGRLFVYYGGGDRVVGVASIKLQELLDDLKKNKKVEFRKVNKAKSANKKQK